MATRTRKAPAVSSDPSQPPGDAPADPAAPDPAAPVEAPATDVAPAETVVDVPVVTSTDAEGNVVTVDAPVPGDAPVEDAPAEPTAILVDEPVPPAEAEPPVVLQSPPQIFPGEGSTGLDVPVDTSLSTPAPAPDVSAKGPGTVDTDAVSFVFTALAEAYAEQGVHKDLLTAAVDAGYANLQSQRSTAQSAGQPDPFPLLAV